LQERRELVPGVRVAAYETSMAVDDLRATMAAVEAGGGRITPYRIDGVGELLYFEDTEGNLVGAMQYEAGSASLSMDDGYDIRTLALSLRAGAHIGEHRHNWGQLVFAASGVMLSSRAMPPG
jgi:hypothetical protein